MALINYSILGGAVAALGSVVGKYATSSTSALVDVITQKCKSSNFNELIYADYYTCDLIEYISRIGLIVLLMVVNTYALSLHLRGMSQVGSFLGTILNSSTNFIVTALLGMYLFGEVLTLKWWFGASLITSGAIMLSSETNMPDEKTMKKD